jgi:hypothetical protein
MSNIQNNPIYWPESSEAYFIPFSSFSSEFQGTMDDTGSQSITVPPESFYVAPSTHFVTKMNIDELKERIEIELNSQSGVSFKFFPSRCRWEGTYSDEPYCCKFEVNVYERSSGELVVEGNRLSGDSFAFIGIYKVIRNIVK